ncbi:protein kinase/lanthionine synthetase C family protein [Staphylococcus ursi]|uniref:class III lanthionine synthetase LanKC N-terminal domain-containing protein n=1 Tax=Staphylococcus sp. MI 10-1553 TaxID=1912064 RepID=UPI001398B3AF|nr:lanthionine synthetase LanC family protein [Staphylococcus sp. MI 10-1553]QHW38010.1 protein kinase/lanthionine synthetase C family protein [Staphylococcus sp. MI 10-1553]
MQDPKYSNHFRFSSNDTFFYKKRNIDDDYLFYDSMDLKNKHNVYHKDPWTYIYYTSTFHTSIWKLHISATVKNQQTVLKIVAKYCDKNKLNFKFNSTFNFFVLMNSKEISRVSAGKFITVYIEALGDLEIHLKELSKCLDNFEGPYILTDLHYKNNIYLRYGEYYPITLMNEKGVFENFIVKNKESLIKDERKPFYQDYDFIQKPKFLDYLDEDTISILLSKYSINDVLYFSSGGGVYIGYSKDKGTKVVIKEARNYTGLDYNLVYFSERLKNEHNLLLKLSYTKNVPEVYGILEDNGNTYLIEEYINGVTLKEYILKYNPLMRPKSDKRINKSYFKNMFEIMIQIKSIIQKLHTKHIVIGDLSFNNFIINEKTLEVKMIDLETCTELSDFKEGHKMMITPGFNNTSKNPLENDRNKFDTLIVTSIFPLNNIMHYFDEKYCEILDLFRLITGDFPHVQRIINLSFGGIRSARKENSKESLYSYINLISNSIMAEFSNEEEVFFPADPHVYNTNKYSVSHGLFGILYSLYKTNKENIIYISKIINDKIIHGLFKDDNIPKGVFMGFSGICWVLFELGYKELGKQLFEEKVLYKISKDNGMFYGNAGILMTSIKIYVETQDKKYLEYAKYLASYMMQDVNFNKLLTGYGEGVSGISLSLIYYYKITMDIEVLNTAIKYFDIEYSNMIRDEDYLGIKRNFEKNGRIVNSPYLYDGIAGVGSVAIRLFLVTKDKKYLEIIKKIVLSCDYKITLFSGYMRGMAGIISFLTDVVKYINDENLILKAREIVSQFETCMKLHIINKGEYKHFLGEQLYKASCDYSTGGAGIILQLYYNQNHKSMNNPNFFLDELIDI